MGTCAYVVAVEVGCEWGVVCTARVLERLEVMQPGHACDWEQLRDQILMSRVHEPEGSTLAHHHVTVRINGKCLIASGVCVRACGCACAPLRNDV
jgi:hypothetical protein